MSDLPDPNKTVDEPPSAPADSLDAGLAAGFGKPRSSLDASQRPVLLREAEGESDHVVKPKSDAMPSPEQTGDRYQLFGEIARGGMGAVLSGRDVDLGRDLAVKVLLEKHADNPAVARRFLEEAQIGGQLQHPNVVPVYDIGRFGDIPFFTMKLVKGKTLAALLSERTAPAEDRPRFLGIAVQVAQALAYAHAHGVIHRDLKPANIMVGAFGEVQVMDWGLAKVLAEGGVADEERARRQHNPPEEGTQIRTARSSGTSGVGTDTEAGSLLGTPAYMPPEQANGDVALLDRRADVFGLGAILCEVLTGSPPYLGRSAEEVRRKAANGDLADAIARLGGCGADAELIALTKTCLAPEASDRPKDARAVADALTAYLDGVQERLRQAELAEVAARARAIEEARRRRVQLALAGALALLLAVGAGGGLYLQRQHELRRLERVQRESEMATAVRTTLDKVEELHKQARWTEADNLLEQTRTQLGAAAPQDLLGPVEQALVDLKLVAELDSIRLRKATIVEGEFDYAGADREYAAAFARSGLGSEEEDAQTVALRVRGSAVKGPLLAALDDWAFGTTTDRKRRAWLMAVARAADPHPWRDRLRDPAVWADTKKLAALVADGKGQELSPQVASALGWRFEPKATIHLLREAQARQPDDFWVNFILGTRLNQAKEEEAVGFLRVAVALRSGASAAHNNLGTALADKGKTEEAIACYRQAIEIDSRYANVHSNLGLALADKGKTEEAIACYRKAIEIDPLYAKAHSNLGAALLGKGKAEEAIACFRKAIEIDPRHTNAHTNLGTALADKGKTEEAIACFRQAIDIDPRYAPAHYNLGNALLGKGKTEEAIACFRKAIDLDPRLAPAHYNLGNALRRKGKTEEAIACYRKAIDIDPRLASAHTNLGNVLAGKGETEEAIACFRKAIDLDPRDAKAHTNLGNALFGKGKTEEAIACYRKAIEIDPRHGNAHYNLGIALAGKEKTEEAIACFRKAIEIDPRQAIAHYNLGNALRRKGKTAEAIACYRKAIELDPLEAKAHNNLGNVLADKGKTEEAIACYRKVIELDPRHANAHINLGHALARKGKAEEAIACYRKAVELAPRVAQAHGALGAALLRTGTFAEAQASSGRALALLPPGHPLRPFASRQLQQCRLMVEMERQLPDVLSGKSSPGPAQRASFAQIAALTGRRAASVKLYTEAFAEDDKLQVAYRYNAACSAALAAAAKGDDPRLDAKERARLRKQALDWLKADLALRNKQLQDGPPAARSAVSQMVQHWQQDADLAGIRDAAALAALPAEERAAFARLWADVADLLKKAEERPK